MHLSVKATNQSGWKGLVASASRGADGLRRILFSQHTVRAYWITNLAAFCVLTFCIWRDGRFFETAVKFATNVQSLLAFDGAVITREPIIAQRFWLLNALAGVAILSGVGIFTGLFLGPPANRRVRSWFAVTLLAVMWLTLWTTWPDLLWRGQAFRLRGELADFQKVASSLEQDWPTSDGERAELGPFLAYPTNKPQVLMLLSNANVPGTNTSFSLVERSDLGALRFELAGDELGAWLEWHPAHDVPIGFVGGLLERHELVRFAALGNDWFLVRYKQAATNLAITPMQSR